MEHKFKVGDKVVGKPEADNRYGITRAGWTGYVISVDDEKGIIEVWYKSCQKGSGYFVEAKYFDLVEEKPQQSEPQNPASTQYKTEKRKAKKGERVLVTSCENNCHQFKVGEVCTVDGDDSGGLLLVHNSKGMNQYLTVNDYEVIVEEEQKSEQKPQTEQKPKQKRVRISKAKLLKKNGKEWCENHKQQVSQATKLTAVVIGDNLFVFDLDYGVLKVDVDCCEFF